MRKESLGYADEQVSVQSDRGQQDYQRNGPKTERDGERPSVQIHHPIEGPLAGTVHPAMGSFTFQEMSAHHGSRGKRNHHGNRDGDGERHGEFAKQAPHDASHQKQRNEHRNQRNADGEYGGGHLLRAFQRGFERMHAQFQIARDILDHHDGVVHYKTGRDGQRHQR